MPQSRISQQQRQQQQQRQPTATSTKRTTFLLLLTALGSFMAGRTTHLISLSANDYLASVTAVATVEAAAPEANQHSKANQHGHDAHQTNKQLQLLQEAPYYINDKTLRLSPYVDRLWLHNGYHLPATASSKPNTTTLQLLRQQQLKPKSKLLLTDLGWNQPNREEGLTFPRSLRMREITQAVIDHPLFDPTFSWTEQMAASTRTTFDPSIQYFVFLDVESCFETNYPFYAGGPEHNCDRAANRSTARTPMPDNPCYGVYSCHVIQKVLQSPLFRQVPTARLFFFDCHGIGFNANYRKNRERSPQLSVVCISCEPGQQLNTSDMGQPPPAVNPARLSHSQRTDIRETCKNDMDGSGSDASPTSTDTRTKRRPYFLSFVGTPRTDTDVRAKLLKLHNLKQGILLMETLPFHYTFGPQNISSQDIMRDSIFAATPRGDQRFSYRFTEALSAGTIPVLHADGWVLPFSQHLVDWKECAVIIPEAQVHETITILKRIDPATRCRMRRRCYEIYTQYMANAEGTIAGVLETATRMIAAVD